MSSTRRAFGALLALSLLLVLPLDPARATQNPPPPVANPDLDAACGLDLSLVIDRSGSIGSNNTKVQGAAQAFVDALVGTGSTVQVVSFATRATAEPGAGEDLSDLAFSDPASLTIPLFPSNGSTNWDDALEMVRRSPAGTAPLTVMITDGDPTRHNEDRPNGHGGDLGGNGSFPSSDDQAAAVEEADLLKGAGNHLFVVGVGAALSNAQSEARIAAISGPDELTFGGGGEPSSPFGTADYTLVEDFDALRTTVARFVRELCGPSLNLTKKLQRADGTTVTATDADPFTFTATVSPAASQWTSPAQAPGASATLTTVDGGANFVWEPATPSSASTVTLSEQARSGWVFNGLRCWRSDLDGNPATLVVDDVGTNAPGQSKSAIAQLPPVGPYQAMNCEVYNRQVRSATVTVDKVTVPAGRPEAFSFTLSTGGDPLHTIPALTDASAPAAFPSVAPGTYSIAEAAHPLFTPAGASCDDLSTQAVEQASPSGLVVGEASSWRCTFTNALKDGTLTIVKDLEGAPAGTFSFTSTVPGHGSFSLSPTAADDDSVSFTVPAGTYQVAEDGAAPYTTDAVCSPGSTPGAIVVAPAAETVCTFTNTAPAPTITVVKEAGLAEVAEPGGPVPYTVTIQNTSVEPLTVTALTDEVGGEVLDLLTLPGSTCGALPSPLAPGQQASCTFTAPVAGNAGDVVEDLVEAVAEDGDGNEASASDTATVEVTDVAPELSVVKSAEPALVAEPGGTVTYHVAVTNPSNEPVTLLALSDQVGSDPAVDLTAVGAPITSTTCALVEILSGATYECEFTAAVSGGAGDVVTDVVRALAIDDDGSWVTAEDDAAVTLTDVLPQIEVTKSAEPTVVDEPGGTVTYTVQIENLTAEPVVIDSIVDAVDGADPIPAGGTCADLIGTTLEGLGSTSCTFELPVSGSAEDGPVGDVVTVTASDDDENTTEGSSGAVVDLRDVLPSITVSKTAEPGSVTEPAGAVTFTVEITNTSVEPVEITSLVDQVGDGEPVDLTTVDGDCADLVGTSLAPDASTTCSFTLEVSGNAGDDVTDTVTVTATDDEDNETTGDDDATVEVTDALPAISVSKDTSTPTLVVPGGPATYTVVITNESVEPVTVTSIVDTIFGIELDVTQVADPVTATSCATGVVLAAAGEDGDEHTCSFTVELEANQAATATDVVTVVVTDDEDNEASDDDDATTVIAAAPAPLPFEEPDPTTTTTSRAPLPFTGSSTRGWLALADALLIAGMALLLAEVTARRRRVGS